MSEQEPSAYKALNHRQRRFVDAYFAHGFNATQAALAAGYAESSSRVQGHRLITNDNVDAAIRERMAELAMSAEEVLARLTAIARGDLGDFFRVQEDRVEISRTDPETGKETVEERIYRYAVLDLLQAKEQGRAFLLKSYSRTQHGERIELYSAHEALVQLGKYRKLFTDKVEHSGSVDVARMSDDELERLAKQLGLDG